MFPAICTRCGTHVDHVLNVLGGEKPTLKYYD